MTASKLALLGGEPLGPIEQDPHSRFDPHAVDRVVQLMRSGHTVGLNKNSPEIREAEEAVARWQGVPHCLLASSGHAALQDCLMGLEVSWGDEVITTPFTWGALTDLQGPKNHVDRALETGRGGLPRGAIAELQTKDLPIRGDGLEPRLTERGEDGQAGKRISED